MVDGPYRTQAEVEDVDISRDCPRCGLTNPPRAQRCDCGWDFDKATLGPSYLASRNVGRRDGSGKANTRLIVGALLIVAGVLATIASSSSTGGGLVFYGAVAVGVVNVIRGLALRQGG